MDATQMINDSILESDEEENEEENENKRGRPLAKLCILKNQHIPEAELPLFLGENILGRDPNTCTVPLPAASISKQHAAICISVYRRRGCHSEVDVEALVWDLGSMNGTRKGHLKLTPNVRYALRDTISVSRNSGVKARLADASGEKGGDTSTGGKKCVNGGTKARVSLPDLEDTGKTPVRTGCLTFEQTPTQPQGTLVPESDSDSEGERGGANRRHKALVSDSDKSSPTCSTFLSPTNRIASVDESPITPSSSTINRPSRHVSFSMETDIYVGRQQLKEKKALVIVDDSEEEEERAALGGRKSDGCNVSLTGEDESPVSTAEVAIPAFNMDSDTDVEGEEEGVACTGPVTLNTNQQADQPPNTAQFHMDSDTDVDEDDDAIDKIPKSVPSSADNTKPPHVISVIQPEAITMDSDTDVDDDAVVSDAASEAKPVSFQSTETADSAPSMQIKDFYLDSDTDVDEEEEKGSRTINTCSKIDETPTRLDIKSTGAESAAVTAHSLHLDSDTDDETVPAPVISEPSAASAVTESCIAEDTGSDVDALSDSDTDDDSCLVIPCVATTLKFVPCNAPEALQSDSDADTDVDEPSVPPAGDGVNPADLRVDSDTDVEDEKVDFRSAGDSQVPSLQRENTPGLLVPLLQNCSTPVQGGEVEDMDTQAFLSPSSCPFRSAVASAVRLESLSSCSGSQEDEDFVVAETQSFILQTRDCQDNTPEDHNKPPNRAFGPESSGDENGEQSGRQGSFQLGLSDSSHLQDQAQVLAMESTQAFVSVERGLNMEETRPYAAISNAERTSVENESNLEATQDYGEVEEPARCSVTSEIEDQVDLALEATQAYISEPSDSEDKTDEDERKDTATQPLDFPVSSTLTTMETQPMSVFEEEECLDEENPFCSGLQVKARPQNETQEREEPEEDEPQARTLTQPVVTGDDGETDDEDSMPVIRKRKAKPLQLEEESQTLTNSELSAVEGQPMDTREDGESDDEDSMPVIRKRKAKPLQLEEESQTLTNSELSAVEAQPVVTGDDGESDDEDSVPGPRKRKAKPLQIQEEETQTLTNSEASTVETQPLETDSDLQPQRGKGGQSEVGTSGITIRCKTGTRARLREEEGQAGSSELPKRQTRGKNKVLQTTRGSRGKSRPDEDVERAKQTRGKKTISQPKDDEKEEETEVNKHAENNNLIKEQEAGRLVEEGEKERKEMDERREEERKQRREEQEKLERERKEKEEQEARNAERLRLEHERAEKETIQRERKEQEEKERADRAQKEKEQLERERKEKEEKERLEHEKAEREDRERLEREENERIEKERKEQEENARLETAKRELEERLERERKEQEHQERLESEAKERENKPKAPARGRRAARRTTAATCTTELEQDSTISINDDVPARRTRSRSNSSNSVKSEMSASSVSTQESSGRGRGRGAKRTSEPPRAAAARSSNRRRTVDAGPTPQGVLLRSNSNNSLNSEISSCSLNSQSRGRGGRQRGRGRRTETDSLINNQRDQNSAPKSPARGRKSRKADESCNAVPLEDEKEKADSQQASTTRGQRRANANGSEPAAADEEDSSYQEEGCATEELVPLKKNIRAKGQKAVKSKTVEASVAPAVNDGGEAKGKGRKRDLEPNTEEESSSSFKISKGTTEAAEAKTKDKVPVQAKRRGRASTSQAKKTSTEVEVKEESERMEEEIVERRGRGRPSAVQKKKIQEQEESGSSVDQDAHVESSEPQTPKSSGSRKRQATADFSPVAKTPRSSSASPAASGRLRTASQAYKVLFTGVVDEAGERVLARLGGMHGERCGRHESSGD
ncbi:Mediator of DNA damage checkpoint protein 1 [Larimichthys crocea]|uniref:Uncharacterized protein n=1 Tax=Larimichthys crocea TaxID=215358 RepID=A0ACD3QU90_LARCR|nr:Mediator of DNA damage checkpoint protein 1 [Larimichthys crocea]